MERDNSLVSKDPSKTFSDLSCRDFLLGRIFCLFFVFFCGCVAVFVGCVVGAGVVLRSFSRGMGAWDVRLVVFQTMRAAMCAGPQK